GVAAAALKEAVRRIEAIGLSCSASSVRAGLVACTGNMGCKFAASDTKRHAEEIARWCEERVELDQPVNIHLTGCPNSCAQHYVGDIGLLATKIDAGDEEVEGYHLILGGAAGVEATLGREIARDIPAEELPFRIERLLRGYLAARQ